MSAPPVESPVVSVPEEKAKVEASSTEIDAEAQAILAKIKDQMEYYFSDDNFRDDKFLRAKVAEDADGFVPLEVFMTFKKIKSMTSDASLLPRALEDSEELELSEDLTAVRRTHPLPEDDDRESRTVYAKGPFPGDASLEKLRDWASLAGEVSRLDMRRMKNKEKSFKGSVFIVYAKSESLTQLADLFEKKELKFEGVPLLKLESKKAYSARKKVERDERKAKKVAAGGGKAGPTGAKKVAGAASTSTAPKRPPRDAAEKVEEDEVIVQGKNGPRAFKKELIPGTILRVTDMGPDIDLDSGKLQNLFNFISGGALKFVEYHKDTKVAFARFATGR